MIKLYSSCGGATTLSPSGFLNLCKQTIITKQRKIIVPPRIKRDVYISVNKELLLIVTIQIQLSISTQNSSQNVISKNSKC